MRQQHESYGPSDAARSFLALGCKHLLIGGQWVEAVSGRTFETVNPATGEPLATVAEGDVTDIDRAVAAARTAFDEGPWPRETPAQRTKLLLRLAELIDPLARALRAGTVWINCYNQIDVTSPFGGYKQSGFGRELGLHSLELYTQLKSVWLRIEERS